jgi:hypothetical protein
MLKIAVLLLAFACAVDAAFTYNQYQQACRNVSAATYVQIKYSNYPEIEFETDNVRLTWANGNQVYLDDPQDPEPTDLDEEKAAKKSAKKEQTGMRKFFLLLLKETKNILEIESYLKPRRFEMTMPAKFLWHLFQDNIQIEFEQGNVGFGFFSL